MKQVLIGVLGAVGVAAAGSAAIVASGAIDMAADSPHSPAVQRLIEWARDRAIDRSAGGIALPDDLTNAESVRRGAGNYASMCADCHLSPGVESSEIHRGLYPEPPVFVRTSVATTVLDARLAARQFWAIKHGVKASGMPAWSKGGMDDKAIWEIVAFLQKLPSLDAEQYRQLVAASDGHSHDGAGKHDHAAGGCAEPAPSTTPATKAHAHRHPHSHGADQH